MAEIPLRHRSPVSLRDCNLSKSFELIGDRWTLLILREVFQGIRRFDQLTGDITDDSSLVDLQDILDQLTGLYNRRFLVTQLEPLVQRYTVPLVSFLQRMTGDRGNEERTWRSICRRMGTNTRMQSSSRAICAALSSQSLFV
jgi:DNA-binding HxlR family transcriptional regulator